MLGHRAARDKLGPRATIGVVMAGGASLLGRLAFRDWRAITVLFATSTLLESIAIGHLTAFTPLFLRDELHVPESEIGQWTGLLTAASFAVAFPLAPLWGSLAERYSRKLIIVRSQYIEAIGYGLCALAPDLTWFFIARLILGLTFGNIAIVIASQTLLTPDRRLGSAIAAVQAANPIAISLGPPLGAALIPARRACADCSCSTRWGACSPPCWSPSSCPSRSGRKRGITDSGQYARHRPSWSGGDRCCAGTSPPGT